VGMGVGVGAASATIARWRASPGGVWPQAAPVDGMTCHFHFTAASRPGSTLRPRRFVGASGGAGGVCAKAKGKEISQTIIKANKRRQAGSMEFVIQRNPLLKVKKKRASG